MSLTDSLVAGSGPGTTPAGTTPAEAPGNGPAAAAQTPAAALLGLRVSADNFADPDVGRPSNGQIPDDPSWSVQRCRVGLYKPAAIFGMQHGMQHVRNGENHPCLPDHKSALHLTLREFVDG